MHGFMIIKNLEMDSPLLKMPTEKTADVKLIEELYSIVRVMNRVHHLGTTDTGRKGIMTRRKAAILLNEENTTHTRHNPHLSTVQVRIMNDESRGHSLCNKTILLLASSI